MITFEISVTLGFTASWLQVIARHLKNMYYPNIFFFDLLGIPEFLMVLVKHSQPIFKHGLKIMWNHTNSNFVFTCGRIFCILESTPTQLQKEEFIVALKTALHLWGHHILFIGVWQSSRKMLSGKLNRRTRKDIRISTRPGLIALETNSWSHWPSFRPFGIMLQHRVQVQVY